MEFCQRCGGMILVRDGKVECAGCGFKPKKKPSLKTSEKIESKESVAVIKKEESVNPIVDMKCPKCKNKKAYFWTMQTRSSDEPETKFYRCTNPKCEYSWRVYR